MVHALQRQAESRGYGHARGDARGSTDGVVGASAALLVKAGADGRTRRRRQFVVGFYEISADRGIRPLVPSAALRVFIPTRVSVIL